MKNRFLYLIKTDLIQSKILQSNYNLTYLKLLNFFLKSKTCQIQLFVRLRSSYYFLSYLSKKYLDMYFIEIGRNTQIGQHAHIAQYVTIGENFKKIKKLSDETVQKLPIIGDRVMIHPSALIGEPITIGSDVRIGANSIIAKDIPSNSITHPQNKLADKKIKVLDEDGKIEVLKGKEEY